MIKYYFGEEEEDENTENILLDEEGLLSDEEDDEILQENESIEVQNTIDYTEILTEIDNKLDDFKEIALMICCVVLLDLFFRRIKSLYQ